MLIAGGRVTGRAVLAALTRFGATPTVCDDDPAMLRSVRRQWCRDHGSGGRRATNL